MLTHEVKDLMEEGLKEARNGKYKAAMELYDMALTTYPTYAEAWAWKAAAYAQINKFKDALECADQAISADPRYEWGYFRKARTLESMGEQMAAYAMYLKALDVNPDFTMASQRVRDLKFELGL
jgi:tetratricopeptide (TPR) repeat protein